MPSSGRKAAATLSTSLHLPACRPGSDLPAFRRLDSLTRHRAVIDCAGMKLYLCGPGGIQFTPPPGTQVLCLERAPSGHMVLPISEYEGYRRWMEQGPAKQPTQDTQLALATRTHTHKRASPEGSAGPLPSATPSLRSSAVTDRSQSPNKATAAAAAAVVSATTATAVVVSATTPAAARATAETREHSPGQAVLATRSWEAEGAIPQGLPTNADQ